MPLTFETIRRMIQTNVSYGKCSTTTRNYTDKEKFDRIVKRKNKVNIERETLAAVVLEIILKMRREKHHSYFALLLGLLNYLGGAKRYFSDFIIVSKSLMDHRMVRKSHPNYRDYMHQNELIDDFQNITTQENLKSQECRDSVRSCLQSITELQKDMEDANVTDPLLDTLLSVCKRFGKTKTKKEVADSDEDAENLTKHIQKLKKKSNYRLITGLSSTFLCQLTRPYSRKWKQNIYD